MRSFTRTLWVLNEEATSTISAALAIWTNSRGSHAVANLTLEAPLDCSNVDLLMGLPLHDNPDIAGIGVYISCEVFIERC